MSKWIIASDKSYYPSVTYFEGLGAEQRARKCFEEEKEYLDRFDSHSVYLAEVVEETSAELIVVEENE